MHVLWKITISFVAAGILALAWLLSLPWVGWYLQEPNERQPVISHQGGVEYIVTALASTQEQVMLVGFRDQATILRKSLQAFEFTRWFSALGRTLKTITFDGAPLRPLAIFALLPGSLGTSADQQAMNVAIAATETDLVISGTIGTERIWHTPPAIPDFSQSHRLSLVVPGYWLSLLPPEETARWNSCK